MSYWGASTVMKPSRYAKLRPPIETELHLVPGRPVVRGTLQRRGHVKSGPRVLRLNVSRAKSTKSSITSVPLFEEFELG